ncbi:hypothetical protein JL722_13922 [Aureococcus anophagefferens]|nr:hypothetical protein JL722_13922 [Aureococcus anophagefferens]
MRKLEKRKLLHHLSGVAVPKGDDSIIGRSTREDIEAYHASMLDDAEAEAAEEAAAVIFSGHLSKRGHVRATWKTRWFELREGAMVYFDSQEAHRALGAVLLGPETSVVPSGHKPNCVFISTPAAAKAARGAEVEALGCRVHKSLFVECGTSKEKERWMSAVFAVINLQRGPSLAVKGLRDRHCAWEPDSSKARTLEQVDRERFANIISDGGKATTSDRELIFGEVMRGVEKCRAERPQLRVKVHAAGTCPASATPTASRTPSPRYWRGSKRPGLTCHASLGAVTGAELRTKGGVDSLVVHTATARTLEFQFHGVASRKVSAAADDGAAARRLDRGLLSRFDAMLGAVLGRRTGKPKEDRARVESVVIAARETECAAPERPLAGLDAPDADEGPPSARIHARLDGTYDDDDDDNDGDDDDEASDGTDDDDAEGGELTAYAAACASTRVPRLLKFGWDLFDAARELQRLGIPDGAWRVTAANEDYSLCPTYARVLAVPRSVDDASLRAGRA